MRHCCDLFIHSKFVYLPTQWTNPRHHSRSREGPPDPKKDSDDATTATQCCDNRTGLLDVRCMCVQELKQLEKLLSQAAEVAATLMFSDGSTQLRETQVALLAPLNSVLSPSLRERDGKRERRPWPDVVDCHSMSPLLDQLV